MDGDKNPQIDAQTSATGRHEGEEEVRRKWRRGRKRERRCRFLEKRSVAGRRVFTAIWASGRTSAQNQNIHEEK